MKKKEYVMPRCRALDIAGEGDIALNEGSKYDPGTMPPPMVKEEDDDLWGDDASRNDDLPTSFNVWEQGW